MKHFRRLSLMIIAGIILLFVAANMLLSRTIETSGSPHRVEVSRLVQQMNMGQVPPDLSQCQYVYNVTPLSQDVQGFYETNSDYVVRSVEGTLYRFDYHAGSDNSGDRIVLNLSLGALAILLLGVLWYVRRRILCPFNAMTELPYELSKGNLTIGLPESKNRYFGRFLWGVNALRETMEQQKQRELGMQRDKKTLLLSLSHDLKTPLSAIKLYANALSRGLYSEPEKQKQVACQIGEKVTELEAYVSQIYTATNEDFLCLDVSMSECYLTQIIRSIERYYREKLSMTKTAFSVSDYSDCLICADSERSVEVIQNMMENAIKYGDGELIELRISQEENCILVTVENSGCTLSPTEVPHIFESFWRGSNSQCINGNGLGLYIARQLMHKMNGDIFAEVNGSHISVTAVFQMV